MSGGEQTNNGNGQEPRRAEFHEGTINSKRLRCNELLQLGRGFHFVGVVAENQAVVEADKVLGFLVSLLQFKDDSVVPGIGGPDAVFDSNVVAGVEGKLSFHVALD